MHKIKKIIIILNIIIKNKKHKRILKSKKYLQGVKKWQKDVCYNQLMIIIPQASKAFNCGYNFPELEAHYKSISNK